MQTGKLVENTFLSRVVIMINIHYTLLRRNHLPIRDVWSSRTQPQSIPTRHLPVNSSTDRNLPYSKSCAKKRDTLSELLHLFLLVVDQMLSNRLLLGEARIHVFSRFELGRRLVTNSKTTHNLNITTFILLGQIIQ